MSNSAVDRIAHKINTQLACLESNNKHHVAKKYLDIIKCFHISKSSNSPIRNMTDSIIMDIEIKDIEDMLYWDSLRGHIMKLYFEIQKLNEDDYQEVGRFLHRLSSEIQNKVSKDRDISLFTREIKFEDFLCQKLDCKTDRLYKPTDKIPEHLHNAEDIELQNTNNEISIDQIKNIIKEYLENFGYSNIIEKPANFFSGKKNRQTKMINFSHYDESIMISVQII